MNRKLNSNLKKYKPKRFNRASINYLYEVSAIPIDVREKYLQKLLTRKNAGNQKNVSLIRIIYDYINNDNISSWEPGEICVKLEITYNMLRYHKSRFLKQLREYYFNWKEISKEIKNSAGKTNTLPVEFLTAKKMYETGMRKEAKVILLRLLREKKKTRNNSSKILLFSEIYELLLDYYFRQRDKLKFKNYLDELNILLKTTLQNRSIKFSRKEKSLLKTRLYISLGNKQQLNLINDNSLLLALNNYTMALKEAKVCRSTSHLLYLLHIIGSLKKLLGEDKQATKYFEEGISIAEKNKIESAFYSFKSQLTYEKFRKDESKELEYLKITEECYTSLCKVNPHSYWFRTVLFNYYNILVYFESEKISQINLEIINYFFLYPSPYRALLELYGYKLGTLALIEWGMSSIDNSNSHRLEITNVNYENCFKLESLNSQLITQFHKFDLLSSKVNILKDSLYYEFLKGKNCNYIITDIIITKIDWLLRTRHFTSEHTDFHLLKLCLKMIEESESKSKAEFLAKYQEKFEELISKSMNSSEASLLLYYSIACYTAQLAGIKEIAVIVDKFYNWIKTKRPEILAPALREIEERASKVKLIDGSKMSAA